MSRRVKPSSLDTLPAPNATSVAFANTPHGDPTNVPVATIPADLSTVPGTYVWPRPTPAPANDSFVQIDSRPGELAADLLAALERGRATRIPTPKG